jgi:hypothetical protein
MTTSRRRSAVARFSPKKWKPTPRAKLACRITRGTRRRKEGEFAFSPLPSGSAARPPRAEKALLLAAQHAISARSSRDLPRKPEQAAKGKPRRRPANRSFSTAVYNGQTQSKSSAPNPWRSMMKKYDVESTAHLSVGLVLGFEPKASCPIESCSSRPTRVLSEPPTAVIN